MQDGVTKLCQSSVTQEQHSPALPRKQCSGIRTAWREGGALSMSTGNNTSGGLPTLWKVHACELAFVQLAF